MFPILVHYVRQVPNIRALAEAQKIVVVFNHGHIGIIFADQLSDGSSVHESAAELVVFPDSLRPWIRVVNQTRWPSSQHVGEHETDLRIGQQGSTHDRTRVGKITVIIACPREELTAREPEAVVQPRGEAKFLLSEAGDPCVLLRITGDDFSGRIRRSVINNDQFEIAFGLVQNRLYALGQQSGSIESRQNDRNERRLEGGGLQYLR